MLKNLRKFTKISKFRLDNLVDFKKCWKSVFTCKDRCRYSRKRASLCRNFADRPRRSAAARAWTGRPPWRSPQRSSSRSTIHAHLLRPVHFSLSLLRWSWGSVWHFKTKNKSKLTLKANNLQTVCTRAFACFFSRPDVQLFRYFFSGRRRMSTCLFTLNISSVPNPKLPLQKEAIPVEVRMMSNRRLDGWCNGLHAVVHLAALSKGDDCVPERGREPSVKIKWPRQD